MDGGSERYVQFNRGSGSPTFNNNCPFKIEVAANRTCIVVNLEDLRNYLTLVGGDGPSVNHSLAVNADYTQSGVRRPDHTGPDKATDTAVILRGGADLTPFGKGFSLVTNFRLYLDDDFNIVPKAGGKFPPASLFAPEQR